MLQDKEAEVEKKEQVVLSTCFFIDSTFHLKTNYRVNEYVDQTFIARVSNLCFNRFSQLIPSPLPEQNVIFATKNKCRCLKIKPLS